MQEELAGGPPVPDGDITFDSLQQILASVSKPQENAPHPMTHPFQHIQLPAGDYPVRPGAHPWIFNNPETAPHEGSQTPKQFAEIPKEDLHRTLPTRDLRQHAAIPNQRLHQQHSVPQYGYAELDGQSGYAEGSHNHWHFMPAVNDSKIAAHRTQASAWQPGGEF